MNNRKFDFDDYAKDYETLLKDQLSFFSGDRGYFSAYKIAILRRLFPEGIRNILDFGAGIGLSLPHVLELFPSAELFAGDISKASLGYVSQNFPSVRVI